MTPDEQPSSRDLIQILVDKKVLSGAQAQLATADHEVTGMTIDEVLLALGWVNQSQLDEFAPWLKKPAQKRKDTAELPKGAANYDDSLREYRLLMEQILGTAWD